MVQKLRERSQGEGGFTLVELLVVMLILGLLAAIAIPSFFNQREKAKDADAKAAARTAQTAIETYATGNQGSYSGATIAGLRGIESTLNDSNLSAVTPTGTGDGYTVSVTSDGNAGNVFSITRSNTGTTSLTCTTAGTDGCPADDADPDNLGNWGD
jgi:type IV pilus assembly protein PilA